MSSAESPAKAAAAGEPSSPLALEFWPAEQPLGFLEAMNGQGGALADWLAPPEAPPVSAPPPGLTHGGGGSSSQLHQQQHLLHSLQPMLGMQPTGADVVSAAACSATVAEGCAAGRTTYHPCARVLPFPRGQLLPAACLTSCPQSSSIATSLLQLLGGSPSAGGAHSLGGSDIFGTSPGNGAAGDGSSSLHLLQQHLGAGRLAGASSGALQQLEQAVAPPPIPGPGSMPAPLGGPHPHPHPHLPFDLSGAHPPQHYYQQPPGAMLHPQHPYSMPPFGAGAREGPPGLPLPVSTGSWLSSSLLLHKLYERALRTRCWSPAACDQMLRPQVLGCSLPAPPDVRRPLLPPPAPSPAQCPAPRRLLRRSRACVGPRSCTGAL